MPTSLKFQSPVDDEKIILVTKESNWTNIKVYANGKMQYQASNSDELKKGVQLELEGLGTLDLILKSDLNVSVNGTSYEALQTDVEEKVSNVSTIFWVLCAFSAIGFGFLFMLWTDPFVDRTVIQILLGLQIFAIVIYGITAILLRRGIYWFYFVGAGVFTLFTAMEFLDMDLIMSNAGVMVRVIIRLVLLGLVLRILPLILKRIRNSNESSNDDIILDQH